MEHFFGEMVAWSVELVRTLGYLGIAFLMFIESSFIPFPSELVMPQAGYLASKGEMNAYVAIFMGILGSWLGAILNYVLALYVGRPFLLKYGKYFFISQKTYIKAEDFFREHGEIGTFTGRLIPGIRQYVSLPAGLAKMKMSHFLFFTGLGSGIWCAILVYIGFQCGENEAIIKQYSKQATVAVIVFCVVLVAAYAWFKKTYFGQKAKPV